MVSLLFGFNGRINRVQYWLGCIIGGVGGAMLLFLLAALTLPAGGFPKTPEGLQHFITSTSLAFGIPLMAISWIGLALQTKRFHDRGRSGLWVMLPMLPVTMIMISVVGGIASGQHPEQVASSIGGWLLVLQAINLFMFVDLGCMPGKSEPNKYGDPPGGGFNGGAPSSGGAPARGKAAPVKPGQSIPGMASSLTSAESAIERAIVARAKQAQAQAAQAAQSVTSAPANSLRPAASGSFGRKVAH